jgi:hypothetical protein
MKLTVLLLPALLSSGCATVKTLEATGGSRSDGTVELSFEYGGFEVPQVQYEQGLLTARERCAAWGYSDAEAFGGHKEACQVYGTYGCLRAFVTVTYQCIAAGDSKARAGRESADVQAPQAVVPVPARPLPVSVPAPVEAWEAQPNRNVLAQ